MLLHRAAYLQESRVLFQITTFWYYFGLLKEAFPLLFSFPLHPPVWMQKVTYIVYMCAYIIYIFLAYSQSLRKSFHKRKILWHWCCDTWNCNLCRNTGRQWKFRKNFQILIYVKVRGFQTQLLYCRSDYTTSLLPFINLICLWLCWMEKPPSRQWLGVNMMAEESSHTSVVLFEYSI